MKLMRSICEWASGRRAAGRAKQMRGKRNNYTFPVVMRLGETPVLIPNTMVKT